MNDREEVRGDCRNSCAYFAALDVDLHEKNLLARLAVKKGNPRDDDLNTLCGSCVQLNKIHNALKAQRVQIFHPAS